MNLYPALVLPALGQLPAIEMVQPLEDIQGTSAPRVGTAP